MPEALGSGRSFSRMAFMRGRKIHCSHCSKSSVSTANGSTLANASADGETLLHQPWTRSRSEEHTSELQSLMRISYAVFCLKKKKQQKQHNTKHVSTCRKYSTS